MNSVLYEPKVSHARRLGLICLFTTALPGSGCADPMEPTRNIPNLPIASVSLATGASHSCAIATEGPLYCWGSNDNGQLGDGQSSPRSLEPTLVAGSRRYVAVDAGIHTCALSEAGEAYCWGSPNHHGALGTGSKSPANVPHTVDGNYTFALLSAAYDHTCGLTVRGQTYCWGAGLFFETDADTCILPWSSMSIEVSCALSPFLVARDTSFVSLSSGHILTCAVTSDGDPYCWGEMGYDLNRSGVVPAQIPSPVPLTTVTTGASFACGLSKSGDAFCWGSNPDGRLGSTPGRCSIRDASCSAIPIPVAGGIKFSSITAGISHACGLTQSGAAFCWGSDIDGNLGDGPTVSRGIGPVSVAGNLTFGVLSAGAYHTCGITTGGEAYCWGRNAEGQLGNGSTSSSSVPHKVAGDLIFRAE